MANAGNNLIVDDVLLAGSRAHYDAALKGLGVIHVAVHASLAVLEAREKARGDRLIGLARWQYPRVHEGAVYDFEVDTTAATPDACAKAIRDRFDL
jgi:chloramphenicol 3-O phosphotransferase